MLGLRARGVGCKRMLVLFFMMMGWFGGGGGENWEKYLLFLECLGFELRFFARHPRVWEGYWYWRKIVSMCGTRLLSNYRQVVSSHYFMTYDLPEILMIGLAGEVGPSQCP